MQAASTANAEDGKGKGAGAGSGAGAKPTRKMSAYFLFQQASRGDMYVKFGGKDAFTSNLHERHKPCQQSTEPSFGTGPIVMSAMGKMWSDAPETVKDFFKHAAQAYNARANETFAENQRQQKQQQQQTLKEAKKTTGSTSSSGDSDSESSDVDEDNAPLTKLTAAAAGSATAAAVEAVAVAAGAEAQGKALSRATRVKQAARKPTPDQVRKPTATPKIPPHAPDTAAPAKAEEKKPSASAAGAIPGASAALEAMSRNDDGAAGGGRKARAKRDGGNNAAAGGAGNAGAQAKAAAGKVQPESAKGNDGEQAKGTNEDGEGSGGKGSGGKSNVVPGYLESDDVSEKSLFGLARGEKCAIEVLWDVEVQKSGQKAQQTEEWFTSTADLTKTLGEDAAGRPRYRITYARRGSLPASKSVVVFLSSNQVRDDLQDEWEDPMLWRKKGCEVAPGPGVTASPPRPNSAGSEGVDQEVEWADDFGMRPSRHGRR